MELLNLDLIRTSIRLDANRLNEKGEQLRKDIESNLEKPRMGSVNRTLPKITNYPANSLTKVRIIPTKIPTIPISMPTYHLA